MPVIERLDEVLAEVREMGPVTVAQIASTNVESFVKEVGEFAMCFVAEGLAGEIRWSLAPVASRTGRAG